MKSVAGGLFAMLLFVTGCSSEPSAEPEAESAQSAAPSPTEPVTSAEPAATAVTSGSSVPAASEEPVPDAETLLLTLDDVDDRWTEDDPNDRQKGFTTSERCSDFNRLSYEDADGADVAAMGLFDPRSNDVLNGGQVVRVYPTDGEAQQWIRDGHETWRTCGHWREGPSGGTGFPTHATTFRVGRLGDEAYGWRETTGSGKYAASTWRVAVRTGQVVSIVEATSPDDVEGLAVYNVLHLAEQAQKRIRSAS